MSTRFNKTLPEEFGLQKCDEPDTFIMPSDKSLWKKCELYDFGWGKENGFYRIPLPGFDELINTIINSNIKENIYGAAAIILEYYNEQLLRKCFELLERGLDIRKYKNMFEILGLKDPINRSSISGKSTNEILKDYERWKFISN